MKSKGSRTERELFHLLWDNKWAVVRIAGSGSTPLPAPDLLAGKSGRVLAIECKAIKKGNRYLKKEDFDQLLVFSELFGAEPWLAVRFNNLDWYFVKPKDLEITEGSNYIISMNLLKEKGITFDKLVG